jgi:Protein of unknown function (DUF1351).
MELKVTEVRLPESLEFNYQELKAELTERVSHYETVVYTDDMIKEAKADRSKLNKVKKSLNDERIRLEREFMAPFQDFKTKVNELCGIIDKAVDCVDKQVKEYEDKKKLEKEEQINELFQKIFEDQSWLRSSAIWNSKWLNASYSMKQIEDDLNLQHETVINELAVLGRLAEFGFEAQENYKHSLNLGEAIKYAEGLKQIAELKKRRPKRTRLNSKRECLNMMLLWMSRGAHG